MATLMTWETSGGKKGRCDSRCHNAIHPTCRCCCGGRFHSSARQPGGVEQAVRNTWEEAIQDAEQKARAEGMELDTSRLRKFIGLEPANHAKQVNHDNHDNHDNPGTRRLWTTINRDNQQVGTQGRLPLEVG